MRISGARNEAIGEGGEREGKPGNTHNHESQKVEKVLHFV